jgi:PAS domain S-box-containing protein
MSELSIMFNESKTRANKNENPASMQDELETRVHERTSRLETINKQLALEISERKKAERALRKKEKRYRQLAENSLTGIYLSRSGVLTYVNSTLAGILGYAADKLIGRRFLEFVYPDDKPLFEKNHSTRCAQVRVRCADGRIKWLEIHSTVTEARSGKEEMGNIADITDRKRAVQALRESEEKYRRVVENANEAILVAQDRYLRFVNPKATKMSKYTEAELLTKPFLYLIHASDRVRMAELYRRGLEAPESSTHHNFRMIDKQGMSKWLEINAVTITWEGRPAVLIFANDISARRHMEDELVKMEKLESLGILAGGIAHDFNNILTAILGNISLAKLYCGPEDKTGKRLQEAERACIQAQGLTIQLLTFAKGGVPVKKVAQISGILKEAALFSLRGSNVRPEFSIPDDLWSVEADEAQISQVTNNLIINADHAMPHGGIVRISAENVRVVQDSGLPLNSGCYVKISIRDSGIGIPEQILPRIFDPYFTTKKMGSGLGLATSYSIVRNHDGLITVESHPESGTAFHVFLPASTQPMPAPLENQIEHIPAGKGRILLMDDEAIIRELATELLSYLGYEIEVAEDGLRAVELYKVAMESGNPFDAVILDLTVPGGIGGRRTVQKLLEIDPNVKSIVSSGYSNDPIMADYLTYGFKGVVCKPYTIKEISETLSKVIDREA